MNIFTQFFKKKPSVDEYKKDILSDLIRRESELNRNLFGPVPRGVSRDFFCLDKNTWIWHEEWTDKSGQRQQMTTRYLVREKEIVKSINGGAYTRLSLDEAKNFYTATVKYVQKANSELYVNYQHPARV